MMKMDEMDEVVVVEKMMVSGWREREEEQPMGGS